VEDGRKTPANTKEKGRSDARLAKGQKKNQQEQENEVKRRQCSSGVLSGEEAPRVKVLDGPGGTKKRKAKETEEYATHDGRNEVGGGGASAAATAASRKGIKRLKVQQHLLVKGETLTPASLSVRKFDTDSTDHCETPFEAYRFVSR